MTAQHADPFASLLDCMADTARRAMPPGFYLATVVDVEPLTIQLDTGQAIPEPVVIGAVGLSDRVVAGPIQGGHDWVAIALSPAPSGTA